MLAKISWKSKSLVAIIVTAALAGCSAFEPVAPEKAVATRASQYWKERIDGRLDKAYLFTSPSFRAARNFASYRAKFGTGVAITKVEPFNVTCEPLKCVIRLKLTSNLALPIGNMRELVNYYDETWLFEDGSWWRYEEL